MYWIVIIMLFGFCSCAYDLEKKTCRTALCSPDCGASTLPNSPLERGSTYAKKGELPWHVFVYTKNSKPYRQICGGTIIAPNLVLSAAVCFWSNLEQLRPASHFAIAAGKLHRSWNNSRDGHSQTADVKAIIVPPQFHGLQTYLENDIAVLHLSTALAYNTFVRPVCLDFDETFDTKQLTIYNLGTIAGFGEPAESMKNSQTIQVINLPHVTCPMSMHLYFGPYLTWDKLCFPYPVEHTGVMLCKRDRGSGAVFPHSDGNTTHFYLRGVFSTAPYEEGHGCSKHYAMFTHVKKHEVFINNAFRSTDQSTVCILPPYPDHGRYQVINNPKASPGDVLDNFVLEYECDVDYKIAKNNKIYCVNGSESDLPPKCQKVCRLDPHPSVEYLCQVPNSSGGVRQCELYEPDGTLVKPNCRTPNYYSHQFLPNMICLNGTWDYTATCSPVCGAPIPKGGILVSGGYVSERGEIPWHAGIYDKAKNPYQLICGGSIVKTNIIISAAHCFWSEFRQSPREPAQYAVAAGKSCRGWDDPRDDRAQKSNVIDIKIPTRFRGAKTSYQDDIAMVFLETALVYEVHVRPVCLNFDVVLDRKQLSSGSLGKVAGWGLTNENGSSTEVLKVVDLPYIDIEQCLSDAPAQFHQYITVDKICAGYNNGTALCKGDSGGGLAFPELERGEKRYYLRGVVSTAPNNEKNCNIYAVTSFTHIWRHEYFIKENYFGLL